VDERDAPDLTAAAPGLSRMTLATGAHHLSLVSDHFRNEVRTFTVEKGQTTRLAIDLKDITPTVTLAAPEGVAIWLDDRPVEPSPQPLVLPQGDHTLRFSLGGYDVQRVIHLENGKSYQVSLFFELEVEEIR
jgi:hypothetical protein